MQIVSNAHDCFIVELSIHVPAKRREVRDDDRLKTAGEVCSLDHLGESGGSSFGRFPLQASGWRVNMNLELFSSPQGLGLPLLFLITSNTSSLLLPSCWRDCLTFTSSWKIPARHTLLKVSCGADRVYVAAWLFCCFFHSLLIAEI